VTGLRALVVDDEPPIRRALRRILEPLGWKTEEAGDGIEAAERLRGSRFNLIITDLRMPNADGFSVVKAAHETQPQSTVVVLTAHGSMSDCVRAMRAGAHDFLSKPFPVAEIERIATDAQKTAEHHPQAALVGESPRLRAVLDVVERVARTDATLLVTGETGTGKEVIARLVHALSSRAGGPFVAVNCGAIPENLVESELFGHAKGAFTGAVKDRVGRFVQANDGTLFLDEIGDLSPPVQVKLLRAVQEREATPVGEDKPVRFDARLVAATHRDLPGMVSEGTFREDLLYRLDVVSLEMPALRDRGEDVPLLTRHFLAASRRRHGRNVDFAPAALELMQRWTWPGNVRELEHLVERLVVLARGELIQEADLPPKMRAAPDLAERTPVPVPAAGGVDLVTTLADMEWRLIDEALRKTNGNKNQAAALLGIKRTTLVEKLRRRPK
jgi:two-component system, NtrC family, response regulator AtoC